MVRVFLAWLDLVGISIERRRYRLSIHETADVATQERWWAEQLSIDAASFQRATLKRHNPRTVRHQTGEDYHGCLVVSVTCPAALYDQIDGWWSAVVASVSAASAD
jgi:hypothetical protein